MGDLIRISMCGACGRPVPPKDRRFTMLPTPSGDRRVAMHKACVERTHPTPPSGAPLAVSA